MSQALDRAARAFYNGDRVRRNNSSSWEVTQYYGDADSEKLTASFLYLHGHQIAMYNRVHRTLTLDTCGRDTNMTLTGLRAVVRAILGEGCNVIRKDGRHRLVDENGDNLAVFDRRCTIRSYAPYDLISEDDHVYIQLTA